MLCFSGCCCCWQSCWCYYCYLLYCCTYCFQGLWWSRLAMIVGVCFYCCYWYSCWCYYCNLYCCWYCFQGLWWSRWVMRTIVIGSHWSRFSWAEKPWSRGCRSRRWCYHVITPLPLPPLLLPHLPPPSLLHLLFLPILLLLLHFSFTPLFLPLLPCMEKYTFFSLPFKP